MLHAWFLAWVFADPGEVFGIPTGTIDAISGLGFTGGAILVIGLLLLGKITAGYLLDRAEARADKLQAQLDAATQTINSFAKAISDLTILHRDETQKERDSHKDEVDKLVQSHEREVAALTIEIRQLQGMIPKQP